jgi:hypothetical protein
MINTQVRKGLAALDISNSSLKSLSADLAGGWVTDLLVDGTNIYVGGYFNLCNGQPCDGAISIDIITNVPNTWKPGLGNSQDRHFALDGNNIYISGASVGSASGVGCFDKNTGMQNGTYIPVDGSISTIHANVGGIAIGGYFQFINPRPHQGIAALDAKTGNVLNWDPGLSGNSVVYAITAAGNSIYIGGKFDEIGGQSRTGLAEIDLNTAALLPFAPQPSFASTAATVRSLVVDDTMLYVGGKFDFIAGQSRGHCAAFSRTTGNITSWDPVFNDMVYTMATYNHNVYMAGNFTHVGTTTRNNIASFDATGALMPWHPQLYGTSLPLVEYIRVSGNALYAAGNFQGIGTVPQKQLAKIDLLTGQADPAFSLSFNNLGGVSALALAGGRVYLGGDFNFTNPAGITKLGAVDSTNGTPMQWHPGIDGWISSLADFSLLSITILETTSQFINSRPRCTLTRHQLSKAASPYGQTLLSMVLRTAVSQQKNNK